MISGLRALARAIFNPSLCCPRKRNADPNANYGFDQTLTKKQIETVEAELRKESEIRQNLFEVLFSMSSGRIF